MAYTCAKYLISQGRTEGLADKLDVLLLNGRLNDEQYTELIGMMGGTK